MPSNPIERRLRTIERIARQRSREILGAATTNHRIYRPKHTLTKRQRQIVDDLEDAAAQMRHYNGYGDQSLRDAIREFREDRAALTHAIAKAIRAGLRNHPVVREWLSQARNFGEWEALRRFKDLRLERGVRRPISSRDFWLVYHANMLLKQAQTDGNSLPLPQLQSMLLEILDRGPQEDCFDLTTTDMRSLRKSLTASRQAFHERMKKLRVWPPWLLLSRTSVQESESVGSQ